MTPPRNLHNIIKCIPDELYARDLKRGALALRDFFDELLLEKYLKMMGFHSFLSGKNKWHFIMLWNLTPKKSANCFKQLLTGLWIKYIRLLRKITRTREHQYFRSCRKKEQESKGYIYFKFTLLFVRQINRKNRNKSKSKN